MPLYVSLSWSPCVFFSLLLSLSWIVFERWIVANIIFFVFVFALIFVYGFALESSCLCVVVLESYLCMWPCLGFLVSLSLSFEREKSGQYHHFREITNLCGKQASKFKLSSMFFIGGRKTKKSPLFGPATKTNWWVVLHYTEKDKGWHFSKWSANKNYKTWSPGYQIVWSTTIQVHSL